jgi:hypothetical protein
MEYRPERLEMDANIHGDAKEVNDLVLAIAKKDRPAAQNALEAMMALAPDMTEEDRFIHLFKVMNAVGQNAVIATLEKDMEPT